MTVSAKSGRAERAFRENGAERRILTEYALLHGIPHANSVHLEPVATALVRDSGEASIRICVLMEQIKPSVDRELRDNNCGLLSVPPINHLKQITAFIQVQFHEAKIINR